jgi:hypothetical protein
MKEFVDIAKKYGAVVALIAALVGWGATWGSMKTTVKEHEKDIIELKAENEKLESDNRLMYKELKTNVEQNTKGLATVTGILSVQ